MVKNKEELKNSLVKIFGPDRVKTDEMERLLYSHDMAPLPKEISLVFKMKPDAVVRPKSAKEISELIKLACKDNIPIVPRGGASWGLGGAVPCMGGIVVDMTTMNHIIRIDVENMEVEMEAGVLWKRVYDAALQKGLLIGSYPSSSPGATIAGWINTAGVGIGTYKYGSVGDNIRNMEIVLPKGQIINTGFNKVSNHSSGYNLNGLFVGTEGTLGIITKVTLKAYPAPEILKPIAVQFKTLAEAFPFMKAISREGITPLHIGFSDERHFVYLERIGKKTHVRGALVNIALEGTADYVRYEEGVIEKLITQTGGIRLPDDVAKHEWDEKSYEFRARKVGIGTLPGEILIPLASFPKVVEETYALIRSMKMEASIIGMVGDRSSVALLPYYFYNEEDPIKSLAVLSFNKKFGDIGFKYGGRPLGLGLFFGASISKLRGKDGAKAMSDIKTALDPFDILNPGKTLEGRTRFGMPVPGFAMDMGMDIMADVKQMLPKDKDFRESTKKVGK